MAVSFVRLACVSAILASPSFAVAQPAPPSADHEEQACLLIGILWRGSPEETANIDVEPVPQSFRKMFEFQGCHNLIDETLLEWNLRYGSEGSTRAALAYLETVTLRRLPTAEEAEADLRSDRKPVDPRVGQMPNRAIVEFKRHFAGNRFLAQQFLRAAEFHDSPDLLKKAKSYLDLLLMGRAQASRLAPEKDQARALAETFHVSDTDADRIRDLELRSAVLQARLSGKAQDLLDASILLDKNYVPALRLAADEAYEKGDEICDVDDDRRDLEPLKAACDDQVEFGMRVKSFWASQAELDVLLASRPDLFERRIKPSAVSGSSFQKRGEGRLFHYGWPDFDSWEFAVKLLAERDAATVSGIMDPRLAQGDDRLMWLRVHRAGAAVALSHRDEAHRTNLYVQALEDLVEAERSAPVYEAPSPFTSIARKYLSTYAAAPPEMSDKYGTRAAYFRSLLASVPNIRRAMNGQP